MDEDEAIEVLQQLVSSAEGIQANWCPHAPTAKQREFLELGCLEALFGGAAGGGKSDCMLMAALEHVNEPGYSALIVRRTYKDLALPGAIMDRSHDWLRGTTARWQEIDKRWVFPSGATLTFGYLDTERDKYRYQGAEFQFVGVDELTQFTESQYSYLLSRLRRLSNSRLPIRARCASNPGGIGHDWVFARFVDGRTSEGRVFVPSLLSDNPHIDQNEYRAALAQLDETTRQQLEEGRWIKDSEGLVYRYLSRRNEAEELPGRDDWRYVLGVDLGTSESKPTTAFCVQAYSPTLPGEMYTVESEKRAGMIPSTIAERIKGLEMEYQGFQEIVIDAGGLGGGYITEFQRRHLIACRAAEKTHKLGYRKLLNGDLERGAVKILSWANADLIDELSSLQWNERGDDNEKGADNHISDAWLYSWRATRHWLSKSPEITPPHGTDERAQWEAQQMRTRRLAGIKQKEQRSRNHGGIRRRY